MTNGAKTYVEKPRKVVAVCFDPQKTWPILGLTKEQCFCGALAQDGDRCPNHGDTQRYYFRKRGHGSTVWVRPGQYLLLDREGRPYEVLKPDEFADRFDEEQT